MLRSFLKTLSKLPLIGNLIKNKEIRNKLLFTAFILVVYRVLASIPLPGVDPVAFKEVVGDNPFSNIFTLVSGGRLDQPSLVAIGVAPYINASIIIQLLTSVIPKLEDLRKQGEIGRQRINQYTRILTVPLALLQSIMIYTILSNPQVSGFGVDSLITGATNLEIAAFIFALTGGSVFLMWLSELITENGVGNGASLIIAMGIISSIPGLVLTEITGLATDWQNFLGGEIRYLFSDSFVLFYVVLALVMALIFLIVYVTEAVRRVKIVYARRVRDEESADNHLPLKLNQAGVMPVIFAQSLLAFPQIIVSFILSSRTSGRLYDFATSLSVSPLFDFVSIQYILLFVTMIVAFTYFYTFVVVKPEELAKNLQKSGAFVPGIRPGNSTIKYINRLTLKLTLFGAAFLALISVVPNIVNLFGPERQLTILSGVSGVGLLIVVGVFMEVRRKLKSMESIQDYEKFL